MRHLLCIQAVTLLLLASPLWAESSRVVLSEEEVILRAKARAPLADQARAEADEALADEKSISQQFYPRVSATGRVTRLGPTDGGSISVPAGPNMLQFDIPGPQATQWSLGAEVVVPLSDYVVRMSPARSAARQRSASVASGPASAERQAALVAVDSYYGLVRARLGETLAGAAAELSAEAHSTVDRLVKAGTASIADLRLAEARLAEAQAAAMQAHSLASLAEVALRSALGDAPDVRYEVALPSQSTASSLPSTLEETLRAAQNRRSEFQSLASGQSALAAQQTFEHRSALPRLNLVAHGEWANPNARAFPQEDKFSLLWDVSAVVSWSWHDWLDSRSRASKVRAQRSRLTAQKEILDRGVELEVTAAWTQVEVARRMIEPRKHAVTAAEEAYRARTRLFEVGQASLLERNEAQTLLLSARTALANAEVDWRLAAARLRLVTGS